MLLVNARQLKNVPGRKTDMLDCQWLQRLHSCGLLRGSFRPPETVTQLRALHRQWQSLVAERTRCVQWMQRALDQMNVAGASGGDGSDGADRHGDRACDRGGASAMRSSWRSCARGAASTRRSSSWST